MPGLRALKANLTSRKKRATDKDDRALLARREEEVAALIKSTKSTKSDTTPLDTAFDALGTLAAKQAFLLNDEPWSTLINRSRRGSLSSHSSSEGSDRGEEVENAAAAASSPSENESHEQGRSRETSTSTALDRKERVLIDIRHAIVRYSETASQNDLENLASTLTTMLASSSSIHKHDTQRLRQGQKRKSFGEESEEPRRSSPSRAFTPESASLGGHAQWQAGTRGGTEEEKEEEEGKESEEEEDDPELGGSQDDLSDFMLARGDGEGNVASTRGEEHVSDRDER